MNTPSKPSPSSSLFKLTSLVIVLAAFATRHAFADFDTLYVAGLAVVALWIMQAQEAAPGPGWDWLRGLVGATVLPVHGLLLAGIIAGPVLFTKKDKETPRFVSTPLKAAKAAGGCGSSGCGGAAGGCGGGAGGGGCGSGAGGCGAGAGCGSGGTAVAAKVPGPLQRNAMAVAPSPQVRPGFFPVPQGTAGRPATLPPGFVMSQSARPGMPGNSVPVVRPNVTPVPSPVGVPQAGAPASAAAPAGSPVALPKPTAAATPPAPAPVAQLKPAEAPAAVPDK